MIRWKVFKTTTDWLGNDQYEKKPKTENRIQHERYMEMDFLLRTGDPNFLERHSYDEELDRLENGNGKW